MSNNQDKSYLYISVFLDEVGDGNTGVEGRIQKELPSMNFKMPKNTGEGKLSSLKSLIDRGCNIASTHALFHMFDSDVVEMLIQNNYTLVIDEAVDCIKRYKGVNNHDIQLLTESHAIKFDEMGRVFWNELEYPDHKGKYQEVRDLAALGNLFLYKDKMLMWEYPSKLLELLPEVYIMTYMFKGSAMRSWLDINDIKWEFIDNQSFGLRCNKEIKEEVRNLITILKPQKLNKIRKDCTFSATAYKDAPKSKLNEIKNMFETVVKTTGAKAGDVFWTTYKGDDVVEKGKRKENYIKESVTGRGYTVGKTEDTPPFLPFNTKATNKYREHWLCLYGVNPNKDPAETSYIREKGAEFDKDLFSLSEMLQFIWRGSIRCGKPMSVLILSERMEKLFRNWLDT